MFFASVRSVFFTLEQPMRSTFCSTDVDKTVLEQVRAVSQLLWMGGWGGIRLQPTMIWTTMPKIVITQLHKSKSDAVARIGPRNVRPDDDDSELDANRSMSSCITLGEIYPTEFSLKLAELVEGLLSADARSATAVHPQ